LLYFNSFIQWFYRLKMYYNWAHSSYLSIQKINFKFVTNKQYTISRLMLYALNLIFLETLSLINSFSFPEIFSRFRIVLLVCISVEKDKTISLFLSLSLSLSLSLFLLLSYFFFKNICNGCFRITFCKIVWW